MARVESFLFFLRSLRHLLDRRALRTGPARRGDLGGDTGLGQALVHGFVQLADAGGELAFAQLEQHQPHFSGQVAGIERLVHGHADVFRADRIGVGIQRRHPRHPGQAVIDAQQHLLPVAQQHGGKIAYGQARFKNVFGDQAQTAVALPGQHALCRLWAAGFQRSPGLLQVGIEPTGNLITPAAQLTHAVQKRQLRGARRLGTIEQGIVKARQHLGKGLRQHWQGGLTGHAKQVLVTTGLTGGMRIGHHAQRLHTLTGAGLLINKLGNADTAPETARAW